MTNKNTLKDHGIELFINIYSEIVDQLPDTNYGIGVSTDGYKEGKDIVITFVLRR